MSFFIAFLVNPFIGLLFSLLFLRKGKYNDQGKIFMYITISLFFAVLAFTQKSTSADVETDIIRYYDSYKDCIYYSIFDKDLYFNLNITFLAFDIISRVIVAVSGNVQFFSFFWTFICYILFFLSLDNYLRFRNIKLSKKDHFILILVSVTSLLLFTQITETVKQAVSISCFFYGYSLFLCGNKKSMIFWIILSLFCHLSSVFLLLMFIPFLFSQKYFNIILITSLILGILNVMNILNLILSMVGVETYLLEILSHKTEKYAEDLGGFSISAIFIIELLVILLACLYIKKSTYHSPKYFNLMLPYLCVLFLNISSPHNFDRYLNLAAFPLAVLIIDMLSLKSRIVKNRSKIIILVCLSLFLVNARKTYFRTLAETGYTSSYMDNSLTKILVSPSFVYLDYKYE